MNAYDVIGRAVADSVAALGSAWRGLQSSGGASARADRLGTWLDQFSDASLDQRDARRTVRALFRGATVRN